jgi:hypothetical protein
LNNPTFEEKYFKLNLYRLLTGLLHIFLDIPMKICDNSYLQPSSPYLIQSTAKCHMMLFFLKMFFYPSRKTPIIQCTVFENPINHQKERLDPSLVLAVHGCMIKNWFFIHPATN